MAKRIKTGGGNRKGIPNKSTADVRALIDSVVDMSVLIKKMFELVKGVTVKKTLKSGEIDVYTMPPDPVAAKLLMEYRYGRPSQTIDMNLAGDVKVIRDDV